MGVVLLVAACSEPPALEPVPIEAPEKVEAPPPPKAMEWAEAYGLLQKRDRWNGAAEEKRLEAAKVVAGRLTGFEFAAVETFECGDAKNEVALFVHEPTNLEFALLPGDTFTMGSPKSERFRYDEEEQHEATVAPLLISRTEVTQSAWQRVMGENPSHFSEEGAERPVESVSWEQALEFCALAGLELPPEAAWEYACRGGTTTTFCYGDNPMRLGGYGWYADNAGRTTHPVSSKLANAFGLFDVHGNVLEWMAEPYYGGYGESAEASDSEHRTVRGGSYSDMFFALRSAFRFGVPVNAEHEVIGFRAAKRLSAD